MVTIYLHGERGLCGFEISSIRIPEDRVSPYAHVHVCTRREYRNFVTHQIFMSRTNSCYPIGSLLRYIMHFNFQVENFFLFSSPFFGNSPVGKGMEWRINLDMAAVPRRGISFEKNSMRVLHTVPNTRLPRPGLKGKRTRQIEISFRYFLRFEWKMFPDST